MGIEGNNSALRQRIRRVFRKTCCFSKKLRNHRKAFNMAFFISIMGTSDPSAYFVDHHPFPFPKTSRILRRKGSGSGALTVPPRSSPGSGASAGKLREKE